jgi:hypothetical protein
MHNFTADYHLSNKKIAHSSLNLTSSDINPQVLSSKNLTNYGDVVMVWLTRSLPRDGEAAALAPAPSPWFLGAAQATSSKPGGTSSTSTLTSTSKMMAGGASLTDGMLPVVEDGLLGLNDSPEVAGLPVKGPCAPRAHLQPVIVAMQVGEKDVDGDGRGRRRYGS